MRRQIGSRRNNCGRSAAVVGRVGGDDFVEGIAPSLAFPRRRGKELA